MRLVAACLLAFANALAAQELRWQLPPRGAAIYERQFGLDRKVVPEDAWTPEPWEGRVPVAAVLAGELDAGMKSMQAPCSDVRSLLSALCFDLDKAKGGKTKAEFDTRGRIARFRLDVVYGALGADGSQTVSATLEPDPKASRAAGDAPHLPTIVGKIEAKRTIDRERGLVTALQGTAEFRLDYPEHVDGDRKHPLRVVTLKIGDAWTLREVASHPTPEWQTRIDDAIRKSINHLRGRLQHRLDNWPEPGGDPYHDISAGELAITLLALVRGGENIRDPMLQRGYDALRRRNIEGTYSLAVAILALEALYTPGGEWLAIREGRISGPLPRNPSPDDQKLLREWVAALLDNVDTNNDLAYLRRWHYGPSKEWDNSNTQYALLGLYGAQLCGIEISPQIWTASAAHWLMIDVRDGDAGQAQIVAHKDVGKRTRATGGKIQPKGWGYRDAGPTGSMTTAGISALSLCASALRMQKKGGTKLLNEIDADIRSGLYWLQLNFSARQNPRGGDSWHLYYLYGLERACELNHVALLGERDWYFEGSVQLLGNQAEDGDFGGWVETAFGLLFLKKASLPAITGR